MGHSKSSSKREVNSNTSLPQKTRKISKNLPLHLRQIEKEQNPKLVEEIIKIIKEINKIETKKIEKSSKTKS